jgi:hypothetical protein
MLLGETNPEKSTRQSGGVSGPGQTGDGGDIGQFVGRSAVPTAIRVGWHSGQTRTVPQTTAPTAPSATRSGRERALNQISGHWAVAVAAESGVPTATCEHLTATQLATETEVCTHARTTVAASSTPTINARCAPSAWSPSLANLAQKGGGFTVTS